MAKTRKFRLSNNRILKGVCGGIAEWYGLDPMFVRLFYLLTATSSAIIPGVVIYLVLWWIMPAAEAEATT
ncbi:MAG: PspC domain-containing protein [Gammaproteobacteria bacterium]